MKPKVIAIIGPTACGKTEMSVELAKQLNTEIVSADSRLVYKGFDIATAKPTQKERCGICHHLIDIVEPETDYSVANFYDDAKPIVDKIIRTGKIPIIVGGTGLYINVLLGNYSLPRVEENKELRKELEKIEIDDLLTELKFLDKDTYNRLKNSNKRRIIRALEVIKILKKPISELNIIKEPEYDVEWKMPEIPSRDWLYDRINKRVDKMFKSGILEETKSLLNKHGRIKNIVNTIGYKELLEYLDGKMSIEEALDKLKQHTRNYAKRQITWFKKYSDCEISC